MNIKTTLFLLLLLAGVGVYFLLVERNRQTPILKPGEDDAIARNLFSDADIDPTGITTVTIQWHDGQSAVLARQIVRKEGVETGEWTQVKPVRFPLNSVRIEYGIPIIAATLKYTERFTPGDDKKPELGELTLTQPPATITFEGKLRKPGQPPEEGKPFKQTLKLGRTVGARAYLQKNDDPTVYVVNDQLHQVLLGERPSQWRIVALSSPNDAQANAVSITIGDERYDLVKAGGEWTVAAPHSGRISDVRLRDVLNIINRTGVNRFVTEQMKDPAAFGLDKPAVAITVQSEAVTPKVRTLRIGGPADPEGATYHATWSLDGEVNPVVFTVVREAKARLAAKLDDLREPRVTPLDAKQVRDILIDRPGSPTVHLEREAGRGWGFAVVAPATTRPTYEPDQESVSRFVEALTTAAARYFHNGTTGEKPIAVIELASVGKPTERLTILPAPAKSIPQGETTKLLMIVRNNEQVGYLVPEEKLAPVLAPSSALKDRIVIRLSPQDIRNIEAVELKHPSGITYSFARRKNLVDAAGEGIWDMAGAAKFEKLAFDELLRQLAPLRAEAWLNEPAKIEKPIELTLTLRNLPPVTLTVDPVTRHARINGSADAFLISPATLAFLDAEYRPRAVLPLAVHDVAQITITKAGAPPLTIGRDEAGRFEVLGPDGQPITTMKVAPQAAAPLFDALAPLRVQRYWSAPGAEATQSPQWTFELLTRDRQKHVVKVGYKDKPALANLGDAWFDLPADTLARITTEPRKKDEKAK